MEVYGQLLALYMKHVRRMLSCRVELEIHRWVDVCVTFMEGVFGVSKFSARGKSSLLCTLWFLVNCYHGSRATSTPSYKSIVFRWSVFHQKPFQPEVSVCLCEWEREWMRFGASCVRRKKTPAIYGKMYSQSVVFVHQACRNHVVCEIYLLTRSLCVFCRRTAASLWPSSCSPCSCARTEFPCSPGGGRSFRASKCCQVNTVSHTLSPSVS